MRRFRAALAAGLLVAAGCDRDTPPAGGGGLAPEDAAKLVALENEGIARLERYDYRPALESLRKAHELAPGWIPGRLHLAIAIINVAREGSDEARTLLDGILAEDPKHPHAAFLSAWLAERSGETEKAAKLYEVAYAASGHDPVVGARYGILIGGIEGREKDAVAILERVHAERPTLTAAVNQLMLLTRQLGDEAKSEAYFAKLMALKGHIRPDVDAAKIGEELREAYGNMGRFSMAMRDFGDPAGGAAAALDPVETVVEDLPFALGKGAAPVPSATAFDDDADGVLDLHFDSGPDAAGNWLVKVLRRDGEHILHSLSPGPIRALAAGDWHADPSLTSKAPAGRRQRPKILAAQDRVVILLSSSDGHPDVPVLIPGVRWVGAIDADQDGDLDALVPTDTGLRLFANSGTGTFTDVTATSGLAGDGGAYGPAVVVDFDGDYDLDLVVSRPNAPPAIFANDRLLKFHSVAAPAGAGSAPYGAIAGDFDADGFEDVVLAGESSAQLLRGDGRGFTAQALPGAPGGPVVAVDRRLQGRRDLVFADGTALDATGDKARPFAEPREKGKLSNLANVLAADLDGDGAEEVYRFEWGKPIQRMTFKCANRGNSVVLDLEGVIRNDAQAGWSNLEGRGALVEVKAGTTWQQVRAGNPQGYGCATGNRLVFGIGKRPHADFVRILWPDAVQHAVLDVPTGAPQPIVEEQRRPDSCPLLFSWDGEKWAFVTDFLGVGGVGFLVAPGMYGPPDPTESVKVDAGLVVPRDHAIVFKLVEAMEEVCYVDACDLEVLDHPAEVTVYPDERFQGEAPFPDGHTIAYRSEILPVAARDAEGRDVLDRIASIDRRYPDAARLHPRLLGATTEQVLDLDFGDRLAGVAPGGSVALFAHGWIEYGYTRTSVAAAGEGFTYLAPTLEAFDAATGAWRTLVANLGYPAGFPRVMTYDLTGIVSRATPRLRIRTNFEIYWDRVWLAATTPADTAVRRTILPAASADLRWVGYPREYSPDGRFPRIYDYQTLDPSMPWKTVSGDYTRYGDVHALLGAADDRYVIFGKGEEIEVAFDPAALPPVPAGWKRSFVLRFTGWCKGQELYTADGWTVEPLPFLGMSHYPYPATQRFPDDALHTQWRREWNTRRVR